MRNLAEHDSLASAPERSASTESILCTSELYRREHRQQDVAAENRALLTLARALAESPQAIFQAMAECILQELRCGSAGVSLLTNQGKMFYWPAIAGKWQAYIGGGTPREFSPCGECFDRNAPLLFRRWERRYHYLLAATPPVEEALVVPFYVAGKPVGTIWALTHDTAREFDSEDLRLLQSLSLFAPAPYRVIEALDSREQRHATLNLLEDAVQSRQELADLHRRKDEFLAMLSHELRSPLAPIVSALHLLRLQRGHENQIGADATAIIERQVAQLRRLVDDLLEVSRITSGRLHLQHQQVAVASIVDAAVEGTRPRIKHHRHELFLLVPAEPIWVFVDAARMQQVIVNLLTNAAKYTGHGGKIWLVVEKEDEVVALHVRDNGVGIAPELLPRVFDLFTQAERGLDRAQGGLGVGLTLVRRIVELHGGTVEVSSVVGQGSEFVVRLPMISAPPIESPSIAPIQPVENSCRVLVVDDNVDAADSLALLLKSYGYDVATANDSSAALKLAPGFQPDAVMLDIGLPGMNGYELAKRIREIPGLGSITLVAVTGYGQEPDRRRSTEAGFDHHLVKPADLAKIQEILSATARKATQA